jgi:hypothetical protein
MEATGKTPKYQEAGVFATAMPPDVRRRLRPAISRLSEYGAKPPGLSPLIKSNLNGRA